MWTASSRGTAITWAEGLCLLGLTASTALHCSARAEGAASGLESYAFAHTWSAEDVSTDTAKGELSSEDLAQKKAQASPPNTNKSGTAAANEIEIGKIYEKEDLLDDAEKAYAKALETATGADREEARNRLQELFKKQRGVRVKYLQSWIEKFQTSLSDIIFGTIAGVATLVLFWLLKRFVGYLGRSWGKNKLQIGQFTDATPGHTGLAIAEVLKTVVEEVQEYYRPRDRFRFGSFSSLILVDSPESSDLMEVAAEVIPGESNRILAFVTKGYRKPRYLITGMVQEAGLQFHLFLKLLQKGAIIQVWDVTAPTASLYGAQGDLALEVVLRLKEVVEANAE